jgi:hypothetical protein
LRRAPEFVLTTAPSRTEDLAGWASEMEDAMFEQWWNEKLCDVANLILGAILFFSPWIFSFDAGAQSQNAFICGVIIAVLSVAALTASAVWEEWLNLIVGLWVIVSPWVLGFEQATAMTVHVMIGILVAALAAIELWIKYQQPPQQAVTH